MKLKFSSNLISAFQQVSILVSKSRVTHTRSLKQGNAQHIILHPAINMNKYANHFLYHAVQYVHAYDMFIFCNKHISQR